MSFKFSADQVSFRDALRVFFDEKVTSEYRRARAEGAAESDPELWRGLGELGLFALFADGDEGGAAELAIAAAEAGRAALPEALVDALIAGPYLYAHLLAAEQKQLVLDHFGPDFVAGLGTGEVRVGLGLAGSALQHRVERGRAPLFRIDGTASFVNAPGAIDAFVFTAEGALYLADLRTGKEQQVAATPTPLIDATAKAGTLELRNAAALQLGSVPAFEPLVRLLKAAEMSGAVGRAVEMTVEYVKTRKQFGVPVGGFQAVQHRLADMFVQTEALRALTAFAAWSADDSPDQLPLAAAAAARFAADVSSEIIEGAIQLHGGIGFTWEYDLHYFLRRVKALEALWRPVEADHKSIIDLARAG